ncbi:MAG: hypothetical protein CM15mP83_3470 [Flavobacteriaceae bacterium]|nr:MAG: hypothetical protein CM15mP83_3470 [Flavobacteriaceae bacterium]
MRVTAVGQGGCAVDNSILFDDSSRTNLDLLSSPSSVCIDSTYQS